MVDVCQFTNEQELDYLEWLAGKYRRKGKARQASQIEWDIRKRQMFDTRAVLRVNEAFYYAFTKQDFRLMAKLWSNSPDTTCIHPGMAEVVVSSLGIVVVLVEGGRGRIGSC